MNAPLNASVTLDVFGTLIEPTTLRIQRLLPGPIERVWDYLIKSDLRRQWLAAGEMEPKPGSQVEFVWRNEELSDTPSPRPDGADEEHRLLCEITKAVPPTTLAFTWGQSGGVTIELEPQGHEVLLTLTHHRLPDRPSLVGVSTGWHRHLDILADRLAGKAPDAFWPEFGRLKAEYDRRTPAQ